MIKGASRLGRADCPLPGRWESGRAVVAADPARTVVIQPITGTRTWRGYLAARY